MEPSRSLTPRQRQATEEAARWFARLMEPGVQASVHEAWERWLSHSPENRQAWAKVEAVRRCFVEVPREIALPALQGADAKRRNALRWALMGAVALPLGMLLPELPEEWKAWNAAIKTAVGQISAFSLAGDVQAVLDTDSAVDVVSTAHADRIVLRRGRVYLSASPRASAGAGLEGGDAAPSVAAGAAGALPATARSLIVETRHGTVSTTGAEFTVSLRDDFSLVHVNRDDVRVMPRAAGAAADEVRAGFRAAFSAAGVRLDEARPNRMFAAWHTGSLMAVNMPLGDFVHKLRAYRRGALFLDDALAALPVSGTFPLSRTDLALDALENSYPVRIRRLTRYVTWIEKRAA
ncbi:hypothetical protein CAL29_07575 [Bordetella genomosp. 10]|uniref:Iron dicitrate transport regulator FecR n=1 Tax=Bordetella genomosp. 10 TaxID=1416804 RepID=A0A261SM05_9BORD|nr:DUF4880 domain-containing protein [Bordetella genomosp. 10]OZI38185.1 hypothetical protein CAL29_07575 [Bordetella genomosp. 10]